MTKNGKGDKAKITEEEKEAKLQEIERKKEKFRQFLKVMGKSKDAKQSWNDSFTAFMADDGSGLQHTTQDEKANKRKAKEEDKLKKKSKKQLKSDDEESKEEVKQEEED